MSSDSRASTGFGGVPSLRLIPLSGSLIAGWLVRDEYPDARRAAAIVAECLRMVVTRKPFIARNVRYQAITFGGAVRSVQYFWIGV